MLCTLRVSRDVAQLFQPLLLTNRNEESTGASSRVTPTIYLVYKPLFRGAEKRKKNTYNKRENIECNLVVINPAFVNHSDVTFKIIWIARFCTGIYFYLFQ